MANLLQSDLDHVLEHTRGLWDRLRGGRIFITGGTGFFGCWLLESFAWANQQLALDASALVLTRNPDGFRAKAPHLAANPAIGLVCGDVRTFEFPTGKFECVIHAATDSGVDLTAEKPILVFDTIVDGTRRVLDFAAHAGTNDVLFTSSGAVYGRQPADMTHVPETYSGGPDPLDPRWVYGEGKRAAEMLCCAYAAQRGLRPKIARCFAFVGPYLPTDVHFAVGNFIRDGLRGGPIHVSGDGTPYRSYLYAADLAIWLWTILFSGKPCRPYNVGSEDGRPISAIADAVAKIASVPVIIRQKPGDGPASRYVPRTERAAEELGLRVWCSFEDALARTFRHHRSSSDIVNEMA
jgi:nucleoside-diphosphate-sugar epimerase